VNKRSPRWAKMKVSADGAGVASHAGCELLRELAAATGLVGAWDKALIGTYSGLPFHFPGQDLAGEVKGQARVRADQRFVPGTDQAGRRRQLSQQLTAGMGGHPSAVGGYFHLGPTWATLLHLESAFL
jgi:hypothetical protein